MRQSGLSVSKALRSAIILIYIIIIYFYLFSGDAVWVCVCLCMWESVRACVWWCVCGRERESEAGVPTTTITTRIYTSCRAFSILVILFYLATGFTLQLIDNMARICCYLLHTHCGGKHMYIPLYSFIIFYDFSFPGAFNLVRGAAGFDPRFSRGNALRTHI